MKSASARAVKQPRTSLEQLGHPSEILGIHPHQRKGFELGDVGMVSVYDSRDTAQMFDGIPARIQQPPELLLKRVPSLLSRTQMSRKLEQYGQPAVALATLTSDASDRES